MGRVDELGVNKAIAQYVEVDSPTKRPSRLEQTLISQERGSRVSIFCSTKRLCNQSACGSGRNYKAAVIQGDKP